MGAAPAPGAQGHTQPRLPRPVVLVEVQPEAQEAQALVGAGRQQHQELLHHALRRQRGARSLRLGRSPRRAARGGLQQLPPWQVPGPGVTPSMKFTTAASRERTNPQIFLLALKFYKNQCNSKASTERAPADLIPSRKAQRYAAHLPRD